MKIYHGIEDFTPVHRAVVTSGTFDGVHLGHQKILQRLREVAVKAGGETVVITFWPHPRLVLYASKETIKLLNTFEEKADLLRQQGINHLLRIPFTREFSSLSSAEFIQRILVDKIGTHTLVIGYDHRFGKNREGSFEQLRQNSAAWGFEVEEIPRQDVDHVAVSSTAIRKALSEGDVAVASQLLGRPYAITGRVVAGDKLGRMLGFPTANIDVDSHYKLIPAEGIYAVRVHHSGQLYDGMLYIGNRPTVGGRKQVIEVNLFDFDQQIYGEALTVNFVASLRKDTKFQDLEGLRKQLSLDKQAALSVLRG
ncbi:MAG: bifunctional riboflavin kinase/FAD synthetase [Cyclobacteriaceae bacterium]|nr:bifunctional riboflavin kinase/FAD synthetase [Cyclobacteriaceae bacterium]